MSLASIINSIGHFFANLFSHAKNSFNELPKEQQDALVQGVNISQTLKEVYKEGEDAAVTAIATKLGVSEDIARGVILHVGKDLGVDTGQIKDVLDHFADKVQAGITDSGWNALWQDVASFAAQFMSTGKLNWVTLSLGVVEFAFQKFVKGVH